MSDLPLHEKVRRQYCGLLALFRISFRGPLPSLSEALPANPDLLIQAAAPVASKVKCAHDDDDAMAALLENPTNTLAFFSIVQIAYPALQATVLQEDAWADFYGLPFYELGYWVEAMVEF